MASTRLRLLRSLGFTTLGLVEVILMVWLLLKLTARLASACGSLGVRTTCTWLSRLRVCTSCRGVDLTELIAIKSAIGGLSAF